MNFIKYMTFFLLMNIALSQKILIPMDNVQTNHLKAYGIAFLHLENGNEIEWLLNYRGGSFLMDNQDNIENIQKAFNHRAKMNGRSSKGEWSEKLETESAA